MMDDQGLVQSLQTDLKIQQKLCKDSALAIQKINDIHDKLAMTPEDMRAVAIERHSQKLWSLYEECKRASVEEEKKCTQCLDTLEEIKRERLLQLKRAAHEEVGDLKKARIDDLYAGQDVVAKVNSLWILASIARYIGDDKYEIYDEDPGDEFNPVTQKPVHVIPRRCIIPLPQRNQNFMANPIPRGSRVLAMFPQSTTFYAATVTATPRDQNSANYDLAFDGEELPGTLRTVPAWHVVVDEAAK